MKARVSLRGYTFVSVGVDIEVPEDVDHDDLEALADIAIDEAMMKGIPSLCAECSGWDRDWSLEISDDWTIDDCSSPVVWLDE